MPEQENRAPWASAKRRGVMGGLVLELACALRDALGRHDEERRAVKAVLVRRVVDQFQVHLRNADVDAYTLGLIRNRDKGDAAKPFNVCGLGLNGGVVAGRGDFHAFFTHDGKVAGQSLARHDGKLLKGAPRAVASGNVREQDSVIGVRILRDDAVIGCHRCPSLCAVFEVEQGGALGPVALLPQFDTGLLLDILDDVDGQILDGVRHRDESGNVGVDVVVVVPCGSLSRPSGLFQYSDDLPAVHVCRIYTRSVRVKRACVKNVYGLRQGLGRSHWGACGGAGRLENDGENPESGARKCNKMLKGVRVDTESIRKYTPGRVCPRLSTAGLCEAFGVRLRGAFGGLFGQAFRGCFQVLPKYNKVYGWRVFHGGAHPWCAGATFRAGSAHRED